MSNPTSVGGWGNIFRPVPELLRSRRVELTRPNELRITVAEVAMLLAAGALAALAIGLVHVPLRVPGHAILRGVLPMALGFALVPRRSAGVVMSLGAGLTAAAMNAGRLGHFPPAAILSILALGPVLDFTLARARSGWRLYACFAAAGALANLLAFAVRAVIAAAGWELAGARQFLSFWPAALISFVLCGAVAGLVSAAVWFRLRGNDDLRRD